MHPPSPRGHDHSHWKPVGQLSFVIPTNSEGKTALVIVERLIESEETNQRPVLAVEFECGTWNERSSWYVPSTRGRRSIGFGVPGDF